MCSTPFGITEVGMPADRRTRPDTLAGLCSTPFGITEVGIRIGAIQLLNARVCSTPFGITEVGIRWSRRRAADLSRYAMVLNAFRHHRGGHRPARMRRRSGSDTPCVLNAFRHHRGGHQRSRSCEPVALAVCSTPFGITEVGIADRHQVVRDRRRRAQRLSASQRWACHDGLRRIAGR